MKKLIVMALAAALVVTLGSGVAVAGGPAEKATGTVGIPVNGWYAHFCAHEAKDNRPAKGSMHTWSDKVPRELYFDVKYVLVEDDTAWFAGVCTFDSKGINEGKWLFAKVYDGGTPGRKGDYIGWDTHSVNEAHAAARVSGKLDPTLGRWWPVIDGNLVVHTY